MLQTANETEFRRNTGCTQSEIAITTNTIFNNKNTEFMERVEYKRKHINIYNKTLLNAHSNTEFNKLHLTVKNVDIHDGDDKMLDHHSCV